MERTTKRTRPVLVVFLAALLGGAMFFLLYGNQVLNPAYTDWLMNGGGLSRDYLGWRLFQGAEWQLPPGMTASLGYPQQTSIAATDSVPLLALLCKLLSPFEEGPFQYFGRWGLACFVLQGVFGGLVCLRITRSSWQAVLGSVLFVLSPILWQNTFFSAGLAGHWIVLAALLPLMNRRALFAKSVLPFVYWGLLGAISIGVHIQLALFCGIACMGYCLYTVLKTGQGKKCLPIVSFLLTALVVGWAVGTLSAVDLGGTGLFGVSLSALWDPHDYSRVLRNLSSPEYYQYAGFAFLGFGALMLCILAFVWLVKPYFAHARIGGALMDDLRMHYADVTAFAFVLLACAVLGLAQPIVYLAMALALSLLTHRMSKKLLSVALVCCLCLQAYDLNTVFQARRMHYGQTMAHEDMAGMADWETLMQSGNWSTVLVSPAVLESIHLAPLVETIAQSGLTLNTLSYEDAARVADWEDATSAPQEDMIFVFSAQELRDKAYFQSIFARIGYLYQWDDWIIGLVKPTLLPFSQILRAEDIAFLYRYPLGENTFVRGGEDVGGIRYVYPDGVSYGPYLTLEPGQYEVRVSGGHLEEAGLSFTVADGVMESTETSTRPSERVCRLDISEAVTDFEILLENSTSNILFIDAMTITQLD